MKPHWYQLTPEEMANFGNGCGLELKLLRVPQFIFSASCRIHDFNYERGGTPLDKIKADWDFYTHMIADSHKWWHYVVATTYFVGVLLIPVSWFVFTYGRWRTIDEILERDRKKRVV